MDKLNLSECLAAYAADYDRHALVGMDVSGAACMMLAAACRQMAARAAELEAAERQLEQMEAVARDLDPHGVVTPPHLGHMRRVVARDNVVVLPVTRRPAPTGGDAA